MLAVLNLSSEVMDELVWLLLTTKETLSPSTDLSRQCEAASDAMSIAKVGMFRN